MAILRSNYLFPRFALLVFNFLIITDLMYNIKLFIVRGRSNPKIGHAKYYDCCFFLEVEDYLEARSNLCNIHNVCYRSYKWSSGRLHRFMRVVVVVIMFRQFPLLSNRCNVPNLIYIFFSIFSYCQKICKDI